MKERVVDKKYDPAFGLFRVLRGRSKSTSRMNEHADRAWTLLRSVEDGTATYADVSTEVEEQMAEAKSIASTGTILARVEALAHLESGDLDGAVAAAKSRSPGTVAISRSPMRG